MKKIYSSIFWLLVLILGLAIGNYIGLYKKERSRSSYRNESSIAQKEQGLEYFRITWYNFPKPHAVHMGFEGRDYNNCKMSINNSDAGYSDAIIFRGFHFPYKLRFTRPNGQIWIFYEREPPYRYRKEKYSWLPSHSINWTMTYDESVSDILLPYGEIRQKSSKANKIEDVSMRSKNRTALLIMSHCNTPANRLRYINELKKFIDVDVLGACGTKWNCGTRFVHDDCFEILNHYKFFLAFENSFRNNYFTEKIYENFDYDVVLVTRGGKKGQIKQKLPEGTFVSTDDFKNAKELGLYLRSIKDKTYLDILRRKQQFTSHRSYELVFHKAMCEICRRMNTAHMFTKTITDIDTWAFSSNPCISPDDFE
ncbi:glycoprotein 3-alpha-L-fucosyltransferase A-like [Mercenaria mercenaria]|uniref:glycoprotein 3-alpha-L-fucosyltransferase A-like n=1 Tax=Mercenaria mercenaria TaxID=6596 RepID=UPI00234F5D9A|nr:glycoprotein 3-alpha-L-fucosyltransferase A-like [Mercenaria mercenaria]